MSKLRLEPTEKLISQFARLLMKAMFAITISICVSPNVASAAPSETSSKGSQTDLEIWGNEPEEYGEFLAKPEELALASVNEIVKSMRLNAQAMNLGEIVYAKNCAECHGSDLKGIASKHTPDLTDNVWRFSGDDLESAGHNKLPSDVEWTVRYGVRSGHMNARGTEANMLAFVPKFRKQKDIEDFGTAAFLSQKEILEMVEYVLQLSGQAHNAEKARRAAYLFQDNTRGNCYDCHSRDGSGRSTFGSTDLTNKSLYLYGSDRASILESISKGRHSEMPAFEESLRPEEIKAVSVFVFSHATN